MSSIPSPSALSHLNDFSDKLSPMLVKELRQGLRARGFTMLFLTFQGMLAFILLFAGTGSGENAGSYASTTIFTIFGITALLFQPLRGVKALSSEVTGKTIEMMVLTRLSARRIILGKWIAIVSQTALILTSIIPYLVLRYFFGGMALVGELVFLALLFFTSMSLTAVMIGASGTTSKLVRVLPIIVVFIGIQAIPTLLFGGGFNSFMSYCSLSDWPSRFAVLAYLAFISYIGWCALSVSISTIAPAAENHSTARRIVALVLVGFVSLIGFFKLVDPAILLAAFAVIILPALVTAVTEPSQLLPPICAPFVKRGGLGRLAAVVLLPGWPAGVFFSTLILFISIWTLLAAHTSGGVLTGNETTSAIITLALLGGLLVPATLTAFFSKQESKRFTNFLVFVIASFILTIIPQILWSVYDTPDLLWFFCWNPPVFLVMLSSGKFPESELLTVVAAADILIWLILLGRAIYAYRGHAPIMQETEAGINSPSIPVIPSTAAES